MGGERRLVTILYADVVGSTSLGERLDPEDVHALLTRLFGHATQAVEGYGGTLEKFIGDAVFAVFGVPAAHGDDAARALHAALELRDLVKSDARLGASLPIRIGVNTGEVLVNPDRQRGDFIVVGDTVNVAARLQHEASPWQILCSDRTARAVQDKFSFGESQPYALPGRDAVVMATPLLDRAGPQADSLGPLVGRESDLDQLRLLLERTEKENRPFLVTVVAESGVGKSRLLTEFAPRARDMGAEVLWTSAPPYGERLTYWPLRRLLTELLHLDVAASRDEILSGLAAWAARTHPTTEVNQAVIAAALGLGEHEVDDRNAVHAAWTSVFAAAAADRPLVVVIEDLHWASDSVLDAVEHLTQPQDGLPLLVLTSARPELFDRRPEWPARRRNYLALSLQPLDPRAVDVLVRHLAPAADFPSAVAAARRADGNPFFVGEMIKALRTSTGRPDRLPDTVQSAILARLDLLPMEHRRLLQIGSVFGLEFATGWVTAITGVADEDAAVQHLVDEEYLLAKRGDVREFRHILLRDVAYTTLTRAERADLHCRAGDWLAEQAAGREGELAELIAVQYRQAALLERELPTGPGVASERAVEWQVRAADVATAAGAQLAAAHHLENAIAFAPPHRQPELYAALGDAYGVQHRAAAHYQTAARLGREQGRDANFLLRCLSLALEVYTRFSVPVPYQPEPGELAVMESEAERLFASADDDRSRASHLIARAFFPFRARVAGWDPPTEQVKAALGMAVEGVALAERAGDMRLVSAGLDAQCLLLQPELPDRAAALVRRRLALPGLGIVERSDAYYTLAWNRANVGDLEGCLAAADEGLTITEPALGAGFAIGLAAWRLWALTLLGRWDDVPSAEERLRQLWEHDGRPAAIYTVQGFVGAWSVARARQETAAAARLAEDVLRMTAAFDSSHPVRALGHLVEADLDSVLDAIHRPERYHWQRPYVLECLLAALNDGHRMPDVIHLRKVVAEAVRRGTPILEAEARRSLALADNDVAELRRALQLFEGVGMPASIARVRAELGARLSDQRMVFSAHETLEALGDRAYLARLRERPPANYDTR